MPPVATAAVALALGLDIAVGELPRRVHPVAWYGAILARLDRGWHHPGAVGAIAAVGLPLGAAGVVAALTALAGRWHPAAAGAVAALVLFATTSLRMLVDAAMAVVADSAADPASARDRLPALVGRDPDALDAGEIRSAAVESAAENLGDGLVAPLLAFTLLTWSLPLAAGGAAWVKAVNTGDSMLGYPSTPGGRAVARLDDVVMWVPARLSALLLAAVALDPGALRRARRWAREPASPNAGWPMATTAAVLGVRLEKPGAYALGPGTALPDVDRARRGVRLVGRAGLLAFAGAAVVAWY